jgi:hypothetical protein
MPDVTININGRSMSSGGGNNDNGQQPLPPRQGATTDMNGGGVSPSPAQGTTSDIPMGGTPAMPTYDRMAQDIRREIMSRGVALVPGSSNFNQLMNVIQGQYRQQAFGRIDEKFTQDVTDTQKYYQLQQQEQLKSLEEQRKKELDTHPLQGAQDNINRRYDARAKDIMDNITISQAQAFDKLQKDSDTEKAQVDKDLAKIAAEIVQELKKNGTGSNSYLGKLRAQYADARQRRDAAETEEEAQDASREMTAIQKRMAKAMGGGRNALQKMQGGWGVFTTLAGGAMQAYNTYLQNTGREVGIVNQAANGDAFGAMQSNLERMRANYSGYGGAIGMGVGGVVGGALAAAGSLGIGTGAGAAGGAALGGGMGTWIGNTAFNLLYGDEVNQAKLGSMWADQEKRLNAYTQLAMITRGSGSVGAMRDILFNQFAGNDTEGVAWEGLTPHDLGYTNSDFAVQAAQRAKSRGYYEYDAVTQALKEDVLEKAYNMNQGSLSQLGSYDRYRGSNNATQDVANLVASLDKAGAWGMSNGQHLRTNEFVGYQTQLMEMQKSYMLNPSSNYAQRQLLAAQNVYGNALDSRGIQTMGQIDNAITNPQEGYSKAILYDVIQNTIGGTRGNLLKIREAQYSNNPETRMKIQRAMFNRLTSIYGGVDTTSGYLAMSQYTGIQNPEELKRWVNQMRKGLPTVSQGNQQEAAKGVQGYTQPISKEMLKYQDQTIVEISNNLSSLSGVADKMLTTFQEQLRDIIGELGTLNK